MASRRRTVAYAVQVSRDDFRIFCAEPVRRRRRRRGQHGIDAALRQQTHEFIKYREIDIAFPAFDDVPHEFAEAHERHAQLRCAVSEPRPSLAGMMLEANLDANA